MKLHLTLIVTVLIILKSKVQTLQALGLFYGSKPDAILLNTESTKNIQKGKQDYSYRTTLYNFKNSQYYMKISIGNE